MMLNFPNGQERTQLQMRTRQPKTYIKRAKQGVCVLGKKSRQTHQQDATHVHSTVKKKKKIHTALENSRKSYTLTPKQGEQSAAQGK